MSKGTLGLIVIGLSGYMVFKGSALAFILFGIWPIAATMVAWRYNSMPNHEFVKMAGCLATGAILAALPLAIYLVSHGLITIWFSDVVVSALRLDALSFMSEPSFGFLLAAALSSLPHEPSAASISSGLFWIALILLPVTNGLVLLQKVGRGLLPDNWHPAIVIAIFFAPVSVHYQIPIYLTYTSCLSLFGLYFLVNTKIALRAVTALSLALAWIGIVQHAGQPLSRGFKGMVRGETMALSAPDGICRASVAMDSRDAQIYTEIITLIRRHSGPDDKILALPFIPEFYFLSERQSAVRFLGVPFGIADENELAETIRKLNLNPPRVVINKREDKYHSIFSTRLLETISKDFNFLTAVGEYDLYVAATPMQFNAPQGSSSSPTDKC
ncbi:MAG: hypothetical protein AB3N20_12445 [Rhizobiaceae bacterium]